MILVGDDQQMYVDCPRCGGAVLVLFDIVTDVRRADVQDDPDKIKFEVTATLNKPSWVHSCSQAPEPITTS